jgi:hypothetical protein
LKVSKKNKEYKRFIFYYTNSHKYLVKKGSLLKILHQAKQLLVIQWLEFIFYFF